MSSCSFPVYEEMSGPRIAARTSTPMTASDQRAERCDQSRLILLTNARIERHLQQVGEQIADHDENRADDDCRRHQIVIARANRAGREQAHARPSEDLLDEQ